jgi:parallel beta-helix repeat protein/YVTN family beta-propeller protein
MPGRLVALLLVTLAVVAGCGGDDDTIAPATPPTVAASPSLPASPVATQPPQARLACGAEIAESVTLTHDMQCEPVGLIVTGDDVVLDLGGHTISGPGPGRRSWPLPDFDIAGIIVRGANVTVRNGTVEQTGIGVLVNGGAGAAGATISGVTTVGNYFGIYLYQGSGHTVEDCTVRENVYGLHLQQSHDNVVNGNDLSAQTHHSPGGYGLYLYAAQRNHFEHNTVRENLNWGLWFSGSTDNLIVRNNIIANDPQVSDDSGGNVYFDEATREGNFWSDYAGQDANGDGIGDVPYAIGGPGRAADPYPFVAESGWQGRTATTQALATPIPDSKLPPRAYVALEDGRIAVLDPAAGELLAIWEGRVMRRPMSTSPDGERLYVIQADGETSTVAAYDTASGEIVDEWIVPSALAVAAMYDGERVIASSETELVEVVLDSGEVRRQQDGAGAVALVPSWKHNLVLAADARGRLSVVYLPDQHVAYTTDLGGRPLQVVDNRSGTRLFALLENTNHVQVIDTEQFLVTDEIALGDILQTSSRIAPSPDGTTLYVLDTATSRVVAIDLGTKQVAHEVTVSGAGVDIAVSGDGEYVSVAVAQDGAGRLLVLDRQLQPLASVALEDVPMVVVAVR